MATLKKVSIRKKVYHFGTAKKYTYARTYKVKKKSPLEEFRGQLQKAFQSKPERKAVPPPRGFNPFIMGGALLLAFLLIATAWIYFSLQTPIATQPPVVAIQPAADSEVIAVGTITAGDRTEERYAGYATLRIRTQGMEQGMVNITPYPPLPSEVLILESGQQQAESYHTFVAALRARLAEKKMVLNRITMAELETAPKGALLIVPSGNVPKELLGVGSQTDIVQLMERGFVIVYIGLPFTNMLDGQLIVPTPPAVLDRLGFRFIDGNAQPSTQGFGLYQPLYTVSGTDARSVYGSVSVVSDGDGALLFLPQTLDGGWRRDMPAAARDVARIVFDTPWVQPLAAEKGYPMELYGEQTRRYFSEAMGTPNLSLKLEFQGWDRNGALVAEEMRILSAEKHARGELYIAGGYAITPTYISGEPIRMNAKLNEPQPGVRSLFLSTTNASGRVGEPLGRGEVNLVGEILFDVPVHLDTGEYIASIVDDENRIYAQTYMKVTAVEIFHTGEQNGQYQFQIFRGNDPVALDGTVRVDNGRYGTYTFEDKAEVVVDVMPATGGENLPYGDHTFTFMLGNVEKQVPVSRTRPSTFFDNPWFVIILFLSLLIVGVGAYFARKEDMAYQLDIPDFPPVAHTKIPLRAETILGLFERVNESYHWETTPLTLAELKNGFKTIFYQGKPVWVSDYNIEYVMDQLAERHLVGTMLEYYVPQAWEKKTGRSIRYLCIFRKLRDIFVNNAVPFSARDESEEYDTKISTVGQDMYLHVFVSDKREAVAALAGRVLNSVAQGISIILFATSEDKLQFESLLASTSSGLLTLKMEVKGGSAMLLTLDEFEKMIKDLKGF